MSGILKIESLTKGNTLRQGDLTLLKYRLFDADGDKLDISGKSATVRLMKNNFTFIAYEKEGLTVAPDDTISFNINKILPAGIYHLEVIVDNQYIFPSRDDEGKFNVDRSSLGADVTIVEATGVEAVARKATGMMKQDEEFIDGMIANVISDTNVGNIEEYYNQFNEATTEFESLKTQAIDSVTRSGEALTKSQNALNVANGIDAKATNALSLSESADTLSKSVQEQFNQVVIDGDSSVESAQARVTADGVTKATLKERLDDEHTEVTAQLAQTTPYIITNKMSQSQIQSAINTYKRIKFLSGIYSLDLINNIGLEIPSNRIIEFENGASLEAQATDSPTYHILRLMNVQNVTLINPVIKGERTTHTGVGGEWGFGISLTNAKNIEIIKPHCSDCWGDGIYLGDFNENVTIDRPICDNNRRQGISVISCKTLTIIDPILKNTNGTDPQSGIDFEPNLGTSGLENVRLINPYTENNKGMGVLFTLVQLSNTDKVVDITVENHKDIGSGHGLYIGACDNLKGQVTINNPLWINSQYNAVRARDYTSTAPIVNIKSPMIINPHRLSNQTELNDPRYGSDISLYREGSDTTINPLGSIILDDISIQNDTVNTYSNVAVYDTISSKKTMNFHVRNPIRFGLSKRQFYSNAGVYPVKEYDFKTIITVDTSVTSTDVIRNYTNAGATGLVKLTLQEGTPIGCKVSVQIESNQMVELIPYAQSILGVSTNPQRVSSNTVGSRLIIEKITSNLWTVVSKTGTWTVA